MNKPIAKIQIELSVSTVASVALTTFKKKKKKKNFKKIFL